MSRIIISIVLILFMLSACSPGGDEVVNTEPADAANDTEISMEDEGDNYTDEAISIENSLDTSHTLDGINVAELFQMNLREVIDLLGPNHSEPFIQYASKIKYEGSCIIQYTEGVKPNDDGELIAELDLDEKIYWITIYQELDIYKGISVGKTLDEMNNNPDLLNHLEATINEETLELGAYGVYEYKAVLMCMYLLFNKDLVCTEIGMGVVDGGTEEMPWFEEALL